MKQTPTWLLFFLLVWALPVMAHGLRVFAWPEGDRINGETSFGHGRGAKDSPVKVLDATTGRVLLTLRTDDKGNFSFPVPAHAGSRDQDLRIVVETGDGHRGEWLLKAADYLAGTGEEPVPRPLPAETVDRPAPSPGKQISFSEERLRTIIGQELDSRLAPIHRALAREREKRPSARDILGGLGYIFGLAGLAAWWQSRRRP